jgi:hypothetical protein
MTHNFEFEKELTFMNSLHRVSGPATSNENRTPAKAPPILSRYATRAEIDRAAKAHMRSNPGLSYVEAVKAVAPGA